MGKSGRVLFLDDDFFLFDRRSYDSLDEPAECVESASLASDRTAFYLCAGDHHNDPWGVYQYVYLQACA